MYIDCEGVFFMVDLRHTVEYMYIYTRLTVTMYVVVYVSSVYK